MPEVGPQKPDIEDIVKGELWRDEGHLLVVVGDKNGIEIDNGTDPCNGASMPPDARRAAASQAQIAVFGPVCRRGSLAYALILKSTRRSWPLGKNLKRKRRQERQFGSAEIIEFQHSKFDTERTLPPIKALNSTQADYLSALRKSPQVIVLGPAGTGKTWIAATHAADLLRNRRIDKIILTRPNVPCGRSLGFFPGSLEDKFAPWAVPAI